MNSEVQVTVEYTEMSVKVLREYLDYDPETGVLRWKKVPSNRVKLGAVAGTPRKAGYVSVSLHGNNMLAHRLIWAYVTGAWPRSRVDHRNMIRNDNRFDNLRLTTNSQNMANMRKRRTNVSGYKGVTWAPKIQRYIANIKVNMQPIYLGCFMDPVTAHEAYKKAALKYFGEFARFE